MAFNYLLVHNPVVYAAEMFLRVTRKPKEALLKRYHSGEGVR